MCIESLEAWISVEGMSFGIVIDNIPQKQLAHTPMDDATNGSESSVGERVVKLTISYDGTVFHGFQTQPGLRTVQGVLTDTLQRILHDNLTIEGSGRTDAGVHARAQVISCKVRHLIPAEKWPIAINTRLPNDLVVVSAEYVPDAFHARFSAIGKTYRYTVDLGKIPNVFMHRYAFHHPRPVQLERIREAVRYLHGTHDFTSFCGSHTHVENRVRTIFAIHLVEDGQLLHVYCTGSGFLYNMVRVIIGTLLQIGYGRWEPIDIQAMLGAKDRKKAGMTAPAHGLTLWQVYYEQTELDAFLQNMKHVSVI